VMLYLSSWCLETSSTMLKRNLSPASSTAVMAAVICHRPAAQHLCCSASSQRPHCERPVAAGPAFPAAEIWLARSSHLLCAMRMTSVFTSDQVRSAFPGFSTQLRNNEGGASHSLRCLGLL
jgi:hypothetical protein